MTTLCYDLQNRLKGKINSVTPVNCETTPKSVTYTYDQIVNGKGQLTGMGLADGSVPAIWKYDQRGRMTREE